MRTRTISSTTAPVSFHQSIVSPTSSLQLNSSTPAVNGRRPRGRRPRRKTLNRIANGKTVHHANIKKSNESKVCNTNLNITKEKSATSGFDRLQQKQLINYCNGTSKYNDKLENSNKNANLSVNMVNKHLNILPHINKNKEYTGSVYSKKSNYRKRKQHDVEESIAEKRSLISDSHNDSGIQKNPTETTPLPDKSNNITFGFLKDCLTKDDSVNQSTDVKVPLSTLCSRTYWPINWEFSAAVLTGHIQKKVTKDVLRKIKQINCAEANNKSVSLVSLKSHSNLKRSQTFIQRRSTNRFAPSTSVEMPSTSKQNTSPLSNIVKRKKPGRPPGKNNKLLQRLIKSNSPRKSPRQHASTLAAIMSNKVLNTDDKLITSLSDDIIDVDSENNKKPLDIDGPCVLPIAVPKNELKPGKRHYRHRRQLDYQHSILDRRRKHRSITPPPPKLCAQQPAPQRNNCTNSAAVDQEVIKLRTKHVDIVRRRARDERLRSIFICQQLQKVRQIADQAQQDIIADNEDCQYPVNPLIPFDTSQNQIWSSQTAFGKEELDNMCLQIMYEQTNNKNFLCNNLTDETLQMYRQQRELALAERLTNNLYGDTLTSDLGMDSILAGNKRKKKRPNMTGWPKEKRRKTIATTNSSIDVDTFDYDRVIERRRKAAEQQRLRRRRIKLEQQLLAKEKSKLMVAPIPKRPGRRPGPTKKNKIVTSRSTTSVSSNVTTESSDISNYFTKPKREYHKIQNRQKNRKSIQDKTEIYSSVPKITETSKTIVKRKLGRPKGSIGQRKRRKLQELQRHRNQTSISLDQQNENVVQQTSSGKLKCVISTRNNRMKLLSSRSSFVSSSNKKKSRGTKIKKSAGVCNSSSSSLELPQSSTTVVSKSARITAKKRKLQQMQQMTSTTWDVGRPKRYGRVVNNTGVEEDCCFVGSQPFEQHCPNGGVGLCQNTDFDDQDTHQKENTVHSGL